MRTDLRQMTKKERLENMLRRYVPRVKQEILDGKEINKDRRERICLSRKEETKRQDETAERTFKQEGKKPPSAYFMLKRRHVTTGNR